MAWEASAAWAAGPGRPTPAPASGGGGSAGTPVTYDEWLALDCDCTPEKPCPMLCGGVTDLPPSPSLDPTWARAVCDVALSPRLSCEVYPPSLRGEAAEAVGAYYKCGSVIAHSRGFDYGMHFGEVTQFFSPGALERTGWEYRYAPAYRICGGVVPPRQCLEDRDEPTDLCVSDQTPNQPCECPPPPCTLCPNGRDCDEHADCISGRCRGLDQGASRGTCSAPQTCSDGVLTAPESDVDCGGAGVCPACEAGKACVVDADCRSQRCAGGICAAP